MLGDLVNCGALIADQVGDREVYRIPFYQWSGHNSRPLLQESCQNCPHWMHFRAWGESVSVELTVELISRVNQFHVIRTGAMTDFPHVPAPALTCHFFTLTCPYWKSPKLSGKASRERWQMMPPLPCHMHHPLLGESLHFSLLLDDL